MIGVKKNTTYFYLNRWKTRLKFKKRVQRDKETTRANLGVQIITVYAVTLEIEGNGGIHY